MLARPQARSVALTQALFYLLTGLWPLVHIESFQKVTGPKVDLWLVKTVGALVTAIGAALGLAAYRREMTPELVVLGASSAASLTAIDVVYVARRRIAPIYLLDALAESLLIGGWIVVWMKPYGRS